MFGSRKGKGSNNEITGFVTAQIYREGNSLCLRAHEVARGKGEESEESNGGCNPT